MSWIAPTSEVLMKDSENLIVSSKLTMPVPKFAMTPVVLSPGVIVRKSNVDAAPALRPVRPPPKLANSNAESLHLRHPPYLSRGQAGCKAGTFPTPLLVPPVPPKEGRNVAAAEAFQ